MSEAVYPLDTQKSSAQPQYLLLSSRQVSCCVLVSNFKYDELNVLDISLNSDGGPCAMAAYLKFPF